jgi:hypothetical protein
MTICAMWFALLSMSACVWIPAPASVDIEPTEVSFDRSASLDNSEAIVILGGLEKDAGEDDLGDCVMEELRDVNPPVRVIPALQFRDALFPWFEPKWIPNNQAELQAVLESHKVQERIADLSVRYLILVGGQTSLGTEGDWEGVGFVVLTQSQEKTTKLSARVFDLKGGSTVGRLDISIATTQTGSL